MKKGNKTFKASKWFSDELETLKKQAAAAFNKARKSPNDHNRAESRRLKNKYKYACVKSKKKSWNEFCSSSSTPKETCLLYTSDAADE